MPLGAMVGRRGLSLRAKVWVLNIRIAPSELLGFSHYMRAMVALDGAISFESSSCPVFGSNLPSRDG
jgi:hypothetical protein